MNLENDIEIENEKLKLEIQNLKKELEFMNKIFEHYDSNIYQLKRKTIKGKPIWIDTQTITIKELHKLDKDKSIVDLINEKSTRYNDNDW